MYSSASEGPQKNLATAIALEDEQQRCFREWSLKLKPYDAGLALILTLQALEMESFRREMLRHQLWKPKGSNPSVAGNAADAEHFFVLNANGARALIGAALELAEEARHFYRYCQSQEPHGSLLSALYQNLCAFKDAHVQILQEAMEQLSFPRRSPMPSDYVLAAAV